MYARNSNIFLSQLFISNVSAGSNPCGSLGNICGNKANREEILPTPPGSPVREPEQLPPNVKDLVRNIEIQIAANKPLKAVPEEPQLGPVKSKVKFFDGLSKQNSMKKKK